MSVKYRDQLIYELASNIIEEFNTLIDITSMLEVITEFNKSLKNKYKLVPTSLYKNESFAKYNAHYSELIELLHIEESKQSQWIFDKDPNLCDKLKKNIKLLTKLIKNDVEEGTGHHSVIKHKGEYYAIYHARTYGEKYRTARVCKLIVKDGLITAER